MADKKEKFKGHGYFGELPEDIQSKVINIHRLIIETINSKLNERDYQHINSSGYLKSMIDEFCVMPMDNAEVGSFTLFKDDKEYKCMIQATGHIKGCDCERLHDFISDIYKTIKGKVKKEYDMELDYEYDEDGYEGFDLYPDKDSTEQIWELITDQPVESVKESHTDYEYIESILDDYPDLDAYYELYSDEMSFDEFLMEKSHRSLKVDHRLAVDAKTGHDIHIVYSLDGMILTHNEVGDSGSYGYNKLKRVPKNHPGYDYKNQPSGDISKREVARLKRYGNTDHESYNQKVLAIIDMETGEKLKEVICRGPFDAVNGNKSYLIKVGEVDKVPSYKSTFWSKNPKRNTYRDVNGREGRRIRGVAGNKLTEINAIFGDPGDILREFNKNKTLYDDALERNNEEISNMSRYKERLEKLKQNYDLIKNGHPEKSTDKIDPNGSGKMSLDVIMRPPTTFKSLDHMNKCITNIGKYITNLENEINDRKSRIELYKKNCNALIDRVNKKDDWKFGKLKKLKYLESTEYDDYEESLLEDFIESISDDYFSEKKTSTEYHIQKFKDKYNYNPSTKTIVVDGNKMAVDLDVNNPIVRDPDGNPIEHAFRATAATGYKSSDGKWRPIVILDKEFFRLKGIHMDSILQHEIGHLVMQLSKRSPSQQKQQLSAKKAVEKYIDKSGYNDHQNTDEFEADQYSARRTSEKNMRKALGKAFKLSKKNTDKLAKRVTGVGDDEETIQWLYDEYIKGNKDFVDSFPKGEKKLSYQAFKRWHNRNRQQTIQDGIKRGNVATEKEALARRRALKEPGMRDAKIYSPSIKNKIDIDIKESTDIISEHNTDMTQSQAKKTLRALSQQIINGSQKKDYKVTQYTANIFANVISKNLLPLWAKGYKKLTITLDSYQSFNILEFKIPTMTKDFVSRFISGRESIDGLLHREPEIKIKMSPRIFHTMKDPDDAFKFFKLAIKYYDSGIKRYSDKLMNEVMKLNHNMKHLISTTSLSGIVTYPVSILFVFDDVDMSNSKDTFFISQDNIKTVNQFVRNIYTRYAAPEKEKKQIISDVKDMVQSLKETCESGTQNMRDLTYLPEAIEKLFFNGFDDEIQKSDDMFIREQIDFDDMRSQKDPKVTYLQEKFGVKKLKKIPRDLVAYISIETESIRDANDKMMISSYCLSKLEIVEWYIELLEVGSKKYIVPHTKPYLESLRTQLLACHKKIMATPIPKANRPIIDIKYPKGYEG